MKSIFVLEQEVRSIPEPDFTETWHPVSHAKVIDSLENAVGELNWTIDSREYVMTKEGKNIFGTWTVSRPYIGEDGQHQWIIGFRNSISKDFAIGVCAGLRVIVCSNMIFDGDFVEFRKHTSGVDDTELQRLANKAVLAVDLKINGLHAWIKELREYHMSESMIKTFVYDVIHSGIVPPSKFKAYLAALKEEDELVDFKTTLHTVHSAVTRMFRGKSFFYLAKKNEKLMDLVKIYIPKIGKTL